MRKVLLLSVFYLFGLSFSNGYAQGVHLDWGKNFFGSQQFTHVAKDLGENIWVAGGFGSAFMPRDAFVVKYSPAGTLLFSVTYNSPANGEDLAKDITTDASGNVYVTGQAVTGNTADIFLLKYNSAGTLLWQRIFNTPGFLVGKDDVRNIALDAAGNIYLGGSLIKNSATDKDFLIVKYSAAGVLQWTKLYNGPADDVDEITDMVVDVSGNVYVTGHSIGQRSLGGNFVLNTQNDYATLKFNTAGIQQWVARYGRAGLASQEYAEGLALDASGNVYVTGTSITNCVTVKYNTSGTQQWAQIFTPPSGAGSSGYDIAADASGNAYVAGEIIKPGIDHDALAIKYNTSGTQLWSGEYGREPQSTEILTVGALDGAGNFYVAGFSNLFNFINGDRLVIKFSSNGVRQWVTTVSDVGQENSSDMLVYTSSLMVGQLPVIVVAGGTRTASSGDAFTTKFSQPTVRVSRSELEPLPGEYTVRNLPNPFQSSTNITYELPEAGHVTINVYDVMGRQVSTLVDASRSAGVYTQRFTPGKLASGVYHYQFTVKSKTSIFTATKSMLLTR